MLPKNFVVLCWLAVSLLSAPFKTHALSVPFRVDQPKMEFGGLIYVSVLMGNKVSPLRVATGAAMSRVQKNDWNKDFLPLDQATAMGASGISDYCDLIKVPEFSLLSRTEARVDRSNYLISRCASEANEDMLGINFFYGHQVFINFDGHEIDIDPENENRRLAWRGFKTVKATASPIFAIPLENGPDHEREQIYGLFDTGAEVTAVDVRYVKSHPDLFYFDREFSPNPGPESPKIFRMKELKLSDQLVIHNVEVLVFDFSYSRDRLGAYIPIILGFNVINRFNWHLDLRDLSRPSWLAELRVENPTIPE